MPVKSRLGAEQDADLLIAEAARRRERYSTIVSCGTILMNGLKVDVRPKRSVAVTV